MSTYSPALTRPAPRPSALAVLRLVAAWRRRSVTRASLSRLSAHELADIGLTESQALSEARRPFWKG